MSKIKSILVVANRDDSDKSLLEKSLNFKEYMMNQRELAQRFSL